MQAFTSVRPTTTDRIDHEVFILGDHFTSATYKPAGRLIVTSIRRINQIPATIF